MVKIAQKRKKIKLVALKYLYEIASIPKNIREEFLQKLLKCPITCKDRKNALKQKNVRLLKIIYHYIEKDKMHEWNEEKLCRKLDISKDMLYCHKHYISKGLRKLYFDWEGIEKEEFINGNRNNNERELQFNKALRMYEIGMTREAKNEFIKVSKMYEASMSRNPQEKFLLLKLYDKLCSYYYNQRSRYKFNFYYSKAEKLIRNLLNEQKTRNNPLLISEINIIKCNCISKKLSFKAKGYSIYHQTIKLYQKAYFEAKKTNDFDIQCKMLLNLGLTYQDLQHYDTAIKYYTEGERITREKSMKAENIDFCISIILMKYFSGTVNFSDCLTNMTELYKSLNETHLKNYLKKHILFQFVCIASSTDRNDLLYEFLKEYNSHYIIVNGYKSTVRMLYFMKFTFYLNKIIKCDFITDPRTSKKSLAVTGINQEILKKLENAEIELLLNFDKMYVIYFTMEAYMFMLETEFWKGKNMDFDKAANVIKKIEWLIKSRGKIFQSDNELIDEIELLKYCILMIEESKYKSNKEFLKRYGEKFNELSKNLLEKYYDNMVSRYTFFSYTAEQTGSFWLKEAVKKLYFNLEKKYPGIFDPTRSKIEDYGKDIKKDPEQLAAETVMKSMAVN